MGLLVHMLHVLRLQQMQRVDEAVEELADLLKKLKESMLIRIALDFPAIQPLLQQIDTAFARRVLRAMQIMSRRDGVAQLGLSRVEQAVLQLLVQGLDNRAIVSEIHVAYETVRSHLKKIYRKLGVQSSAEAIDIARDAGLV